MSIFTDLNDRQRIKNPNTPVVTSKIVINQHPNSTISACQMELRQVLIGYNGEHLIADYLQSSWIRRSANLPVHNAHYTHITAKYLKRELLESLMQHVMNRWDMTVVPERIECFARDLIIDGDTTPIRIVAERICHFMNYVYLHEPRTAKKRTPKPGHNGASKS